MDESITPTLTQAHRRRRRRLTVLVSIFLALTAYHFSRDWIDQLMQRPLWLTEEKFYQFVEGQSLFLPADAERLTVQEQRVLILHRKMIESLKMEREVLGSQTPLVTFVVRTELGVYSIQ